MFRACIYLGDKKDKWKKKKKQYKKLKSLTDDEWYVVVNKVDAKGRTSLHTACKYAGRWMVQQLLAEGANTDTVTPKGFTPLHYAIKGGKEKAVILLLAHGASPNVIKDGKSYFDFALEHKQESVIEELAEGGCDVNRRLHNTQQPLLFTLVKDVDESWGVAAVRAVINAGAVLNAFTRLRHRNECDRCHERSVHGGAHNQHEYCETWIMKTALYQAVLDDNYEYAKMLVEAGADVNLRYGVHRKTVLEAAIKNDNLEMVNLLLAVPNIQVDIDRPPLGEAIESTTAVFKAVLAKTTRLDVVIGQQSTFLIRAIETRSYTELLLLLRRGADPNFMEPIREAALHRCRYMVCMLMMYGARPVMPTPPHELKPDIMRLLTAHKTLFGTCALQIELAKLKKEDIEDDDE